MSGLCLFCSALLFFFFCFVSFCDQLKSKPGLCLDPRRRGKCYSWWSIGNNSRMDGCGRDSEARSSKYRILAGTGYLVCSTYAEAGPGFTAVSTKSGQSPKMRTKWMSSVISEGLDKTLGRSKHRVQWQDKTADTADHTLVWLSLMQMAFPSSLDAKIHLERQSGVLSATWSPPQHPFFFGQPVLSKPKEQLLLLLPDVFWCTWLWKEGKRKRKGKEKGYQDGIFCDSVCCLHSKLLQYWNPLLCHVCTSPQPKKAKQVSTSPGTLETVFLNFHFYFPFSTLKHFCTLHCQELVNRSILIWWQITLHAL